MCISIYTYIRFITHLPVISFLFYIYSFDICSSTINFHIREVYIACFLTFPYFFFFIFLYVCFFIFCNSNSKVVYVCMYVYVVCEEIKLNGIATSKDRSRFFFKEG